MTPTLLRSCIVESKKSIFGGFIGREKISLPLNLHWQLHHTDEHDAFSNEFQELMHEVHRYVYRNETIDQKVFMKCCINSGSSENEPFDKFFFFFFLLLFFSGVLYGEKYISESWRTVSSSHLVYVIVQLITYKSHMKY